MTTDTYATAEQATDQARELGERATEQVREFGERATGAGRVFGQTALDTYEQAVNSYLEFEHKAADAAPFDWAKAAINAHATFVKELTDAYVKAARTVLN